MQSSFSVYMLKVYIGLLKEGYIILKGAFDKYIIYLLVSNSIENFNINQYQTFQQILPMHFHLMWSFVTASSPEYPIGAAPG